MEQVKSNSEIVAEIYRNAQLALYVYFGHYTRSGTPLMTLFTMCSTTCRPSR